MTSNIFLVRAVASENLMVDALHELDCAHKIIRNLLNILTPEQKVKLAWFNEVESCDGEGVTRANEREAVISRLQAFMPVGKADHGA